MMLMLLMMLLSLTLLMMTMLTSLSRSLLKWIGLPRFRDGVLHVWPSHLLACSQVRSLQHLPSVLCPLNPLVRITLGLIYCLVGILLSLKRLLPIVDMLLRISIPV